jgi:hypothetical protein
MSFVCVGAVKDEFYVFSKFLVPISIKFGTGDAHKNLSSGCERRGSQCNENRTFLRGVNEFFIQSFHIYLCDLGEMLLSI